MEILHIVWHQCRFNGFVSAIDNRLICGKIGLFYFQRFENMLLYLFDIIIVATSQISDGIYSFADYVAAKNKSSKEKKKTKNPDPYARPGQKKQGRELKNKSRLNPNFEQRNGRRRGPQPLKHHTLGHDHRKYLLLLLFGSETLLNDWLEKE